MPVQPSYPGVYVQELPSGARTLTGVSTSIAAFVGYTARGPVDRPVTLLNFGDFQRVFGGLNPLSELSYAVYQYFLNGGSTALVSRALPTTAPPQRNSASPSFKGPFAPSTARVDVAAAGASGQLGPPVATFAAADPGSWGNRIQVSIDADTSDPSTLFNLVATEYALRGAALEATATTQLASVSLDSTQTNFVGALLAAKANPLITVTPTLTSTAPPAQTGASAPVPADPTTLGGLTISITLPGPGGPQVLGPSAPLPAITGLGDIAPALQGALQDLLGIVPVKVSLIANGSSQPMIRILLPDPTMANVVPTYGGTITTKLAFASNVQAYQLGATGGLVVAAAAGSDPTYLKAGAGAASLVPALPGQVIVDQTSLIGDRAKRTGLYALDSVDLFNMLSLPDLRTFGLSGLGAYKTVAATAAAYCEAKRGFLILDLPIGVGDLDGARAFMAQAPGFASTNAAAYFPELIISDPANAGADRAVGVSGVMAGLYARTDASRGIWKAPAGVDAKLKNVTRLAYTLSDEEVGVLNPLGLNALRVQTVYGLVCWGARTLMGSDQLMSEWKYVPVRRLALFLEESLKRGLQWTVFEPNDEVLWAQIRLEVGSFLQNLFIQGAFAGRSPAEAFFVACDPSTTSIDEIAGGVVNVQIGFAPLRPAEFVFLNVRQIAGQTKG